MPAPEKTFKLLGCFFAPRWLRTAIRWIRVKFANMSMLPHVLWMVLLALIITGTTSFGIWHLAKTPSVASLVKEMTLLDLIRVALLITGGIGGIVALVVAYRKQKLGERTEQRDQVAAERADRADIREDTKLFNERFAAASEQLASEKFMVRLAGIYAMAGLADDWKKGRQVCIDVLCAYIRVPNDPSSDDYAIEKQVRHTILTVIRDHLRRGLEPENSWKGCKFNLSEVVFDGGDLSRIEFAGTSFSFASSKIIGDGLNFSGSDFSRARISFSRISIASTSINFQNTIFKNVKVPFNGANINEDEEDVKIGTIIFDNATFGADAVIDFNWAALNRAWIQFYETKFAGGQISFNWSKLESSSILFKDCEFLGGVIDFSKARAKSIDFMHDLEEVPDGINLGEGVSLPHRWKQGEGGLPPF
jgi:hypothetical protein